MRKTISTFVLFCMVFAFTALFAADVNVTGTWKMTFTGPQGEMTRDYVMAQQGEKLTLTWKGRNGEDQTAEGTVKGNEIQWSFTRQTQMGEMTMTYKGTVEGNTMKGDVTTPRGTNPWKAEKVETK